MSDFTLYNDFDSTPLREWMMANGTEERVAKKEYFSRVGGTTRKIGIVVRGSFAMCSTDDKGQRKIFSVAFPREMISNYLAFQTGNPCTYDIQALEHSVIRTADVSEVDTYLHSLSPDYHYRFMSGIAYALLRRFISAKCDSCRVRYLKLLERVPDLHQKMSMTDISSYLGISRESFQRMKRAIDNERL